MQKSKRLAPFSFLSIFSDSFPLFIVPFSIELTRFLQPPIVYGFLFRNDYPIGEREIRFAADSLEPNIKSSLYGQTPREFLRPLKADFLSISSIVVGPCLRAQPL